MGIILKLVLFIFLAGSSLLVGYYLYKALNKRIQESETGWQLLWNCLLLFATLAALLTLCLFLLIYFYQFMRGEDEGLFTGTTAGYG